jgi:hypothetical protein
MTANEALWEIETRQIAITPAFDGKVWMASLDIKGEGHNAHRPVRSITATASTPMEAVAELAARIEGEEVET